MLLSSLARQCAQLWVKTRENLGYPLGTYQESNLIYPHVSEKPSRKVFHLHDHVLLLVLF
jgi:glycyl-tRNA synthetase